MLGACLAQQPALACLNLNDTGLTDAGVGVLCKALAGATPQLQVLELALNEITPAGARSVVAALAGKAHLTRCVCQSEGGGGRRRLRSTCQVDEAVLPPPQQAHTLATRQPTHANPHTHRLNLRENELEDEGAITLARGLAALPALQVLDVCANQITRPGALAVTKALVQARKGGSGGAQPLQLLALDENGISEEGVGQIQALLKVWAPRGTAGWWCGGCCLRQREQ